MVRLMFYGAAVLFFSSFCAGSKSYEGYSLFQVFPRDEASVKYLVSLGEIPSSLEVQIWRYGHVNTSFDILVSPASKEAFLKELDNRHITYKLLNGNIQDAIDKERTPFTPLTRSFASIRNSPQFTKYLTLDELNSFTQSLAAKYPNLVKIEQIGSSYEHRPIYVVKVGSDTGSNKPSIWIDGGIHAREWISVSTAIYMLNKLVTGYATDSKIKEYVDKANWYFVPVLNVDGYDYTHTHDRSWRKNRRPAPCHFFGCCAGVDLNRNFDQSFGGAGTSADSCQEDYRGTAAFSEPETQAVRDFVLKHASDMKAFLTMHSYAQLWFYPYGDKRNSYPADVDELIAVSNKAVEAIKSVHGLQFRAGTPADILYPAAGSSFDWVKAVAQVKFCFGMELRPSEDTRGNGFILPPSNIIPAGEETWAGISVVADEVIRQFAK